MCSKRSTSEKKSERFICPIQSINDIVYCLKEDCAWWLPDAKCCAVILIARALDLMTWRVVER